MTSYQIYVFLMCLIVFIMLASLSIFCIAVIMKLTLRLIDHGVEDEKILEEYNKEKKRKRNKYSKVLSYAFSGIVCFVLLAILISSLVVKGTEGSFVDDIPVYRVVKTSSMSVKNPKNTYLVKNNLNNQIQTFDLIRTEKLPPEKDLKLYDVVVYETDGMMIVHRIVGIEEPNSTHPNCRYFLLQGDAVDAADRFPVLYEQMRGIYKGQRIPFVGSFVMFMQSPAGWLCTLFVILSVFVAPILEAKLQAAKKKRLLLYIKEDEPVAQEPETLEKDILPCSEEDKPFSGIQLWPKSGKLGEIDLYKLDTNYKSGDFVDINSLKNRELVDKDCKKIKVFANGELNKALTVKANSFEPKAIDAIVSLGGRAIQAVKMVDKKDISSHQLKLNPVNGGEPND